MSESTADGDEYRATRGVSPTAADCTPHSLRAIPLLNAMVDVGLVLGFDETCSKELRVPEEEIDEEVGVVGCGLHGKCVWGEGKRAEGREGGERGKE